MNSVTLIAYGVAVAVPLLTVYVFVMLDVFGTGKASTILSCMGWGALGAFSLAYLLNTMLLERGLAYESLTSLVAPVLEEVLKALVLYYLVRDPRFRYIVDGAVYGIAVGIGFGLSENVVVYLPDAGEAVLGVALSRTLSTTLMHATASGLVGISLGRLRRSTSTRRYTMPLVGIALAILLHMAYNNLASELEGLQLLLIAVGIGLGGGVFIGWQIGQGLAEEKQRFAETLGLEVDNFGGERQAIQRLGEAGIEQVFHDLSDFFGADSINLIRRMLGLQANIGILRNNLTSQVSDRLREAWEAEIAEYEAEVNAIRRQLGPSVTMFMQRVFPTDDDAMQGTLNDELGKHDPTLVHRFDMFMRVSGLAANFTPQQLSELADRLSRITIFHHVSLPNLENLSRAIKAEEFEEGVVLFDEGDEGNAMYLIETGEVTISVRTETGEDEFIRTFEAGTVVGEFSLLDGQPRSAKARAVGHVRTLMLKREEFSMFIQSRPLVVLAMLRYLAEKARHTTRVVETAVEAMSDIGKGDYHKLTAAPAAGAESTALEDTSTVELAPDAISSDTHALVTGVFSSAAAELQRREDALREQIEARKGPQSPLN